MSSRKNAPEIKNNLEYYSSGATLVITCNPYKSKAYIVRVLIYFLTLLFSILCIAYYKTIFSYFDNDFLLAIVIFVGGSILFLAFNYLHLIFSIFKNSLLRNFLLKEEFVIGNNKIEYSNNFGKKASWNISHIKWMYFEFNKAVGEFSGVPVLIPNYTPIIILRNQNDEVIGKIMYSVKEDDVLEVYTAITNHLKSIGYFYKEFEVDFKDKIKDKRHWGKEIKFISVLEYYELNKMKFTNEQRQIFDNAIKNIQASEEELSKIISAKLKEVINLNSKL